MFTPDSAGALAMLYAVQEERQAWLPMLLRALPDAAVTPLPRCCYATYVRPGERAAGVYMLVTLRYVTLRATDMLRDEEQQHDDVSMKWQATAKARERRDSMLMRPAEACCYSMLFVTPSPHYRCWRARRRLGSYMLYRC